MDRTPDHLLLKDADIEQILRFDRMYERRIDELQKQALVNELSCAEMRVVHELGVAGNGCTAAWLKPRVELDAGYLCRILKKLCAHGFASEGPSATDRRHRDYELTQRGRGVYRALEEFHRGQARRTLDTLPALQRLRLVRAMRTIEEVLRRTRLEDLVGGWRSALRKRAKYRPR